MHQLKAVQGLTQLTLHTTITYFFLQWFSVLPSDIGLVRLALQIAPHILCTECLKEVLLIA